MREKREREEVMREEREIVSGRVLRGTTTNPPWVCAWRDPLREAFHTMPP